MRAQEVLGSVDFILAEDTRRAGILLSTLGIKKRLLSYYDQNEAGRTPQVIEDLKQGRSAALISDAGTPCISDPGYRIVRSCHDNGIPVRPIPGPSALVAAISVSGLPTDRFVFEGFLPPKGAKRTKRVKEILDRQMTSIVYESTHKIEKLLTEMSEIAPNRLVFIGRELTKTYEEFLRGPVSELSSIVTARGGLKGEIVLVVEAAPKREKSAKKYSKQNDNTEEE